MKFQQLKKNSQIWDATLWKRIIQWKKNKLKTKLRSNSRSHFKQNWKNTVSANISIKKNVVKCICEHIFRLIEINQSIKNHIFLVSFFVEVDNIELFYSKKNRLNLIRGIIRKSVF